MRQPIFYNTCSNYYVLSLSLQLSRKISWMFSKILLSTVIGYFDKLYIYLPLFHYSNLAYCSFFSNIIYKIQTICHSLKTKCLWNPRQQGTLYSHKPILFCDDITGTSGLGLPWQIGKPRLLGPPATALPPPPPATLLLQLWGYYPDKLSTPPRSGWTIIGRSFPSLSLSADVIQGSYVHNRYTIPGLGSWEACSYLSRPLVQGGYWR